MTAAQFIFHIDNLLYTRCMIYLLVGAGLYFTLRTGFVQIRLLGASFRCMMEKKRSEKGLSSFQALMIATASRVGTGNMAVVNIVAITLLSGIAFRALKDYERQQKEGKDPVFYEGNIGLTNTDVWKG